ncbi:MAG: CotH kinase family protein, partial [Verrucomicrobia bacterium]|nr:CotH kinase family protein [Verrucomicrobiota bacterium]
MDRFITSLALQTITWNWDGYAMARNNYRIYHDPATGKMIFIPHGLDQMFWEPAGPIYPRMRGLVAAAVMRAPQGQELYRRRLAWVHARAFNVSAMTKRLNELAALIEPHFPGAPGAVAKLRRLIAERSRSVGEQLQQLAPPTEPFPRGVAR